MADLEKITKKRLGELLIAEGLITQDHVNEALKIQERTGEMLGEALVKAGYTTETDIAKTLCTQFAKPFVRPSRYDIAKEVITLLPAKMLVEHSFVPIDRFGNTLVIAMGGLLDAQTLQAIQRLSGCDIEIYITTHGDAKTALRGQFPELFDPITMMPKFERTAEMTGQITKKSLLAAPEVGEVTGELHAIAGIAEEESDWEALFEEADQNVLKELNSKKPPPTPKR
jgi:hypothetical protein